MSLGGLQKIDCHGSIREKSQKVLPSFVVPIPPHRDADTGARVRKRTCQLRDHGDALNALSCTAVPGATVGLRLLCNVAVVLDSFATLSQ